MRYRGIDPIHLAKQLGLTDGNVLHKEALSPAVDRRIDAIQEDNPFGFSGEIDLLNSLKEYAPSIMALDGEQSTLSACDLSHLARLSDTANLTTDRALNRIDSKDFSLIEKYLSF